ncbi:MAG: carboxypeptidase regulatory-like domain-containing protein, partial [Alistipes sp.]|nr:carboxypeptidase regulatory-like domain-containing protein [Alistipes sp.]
MKHILLTLLMALFSVSVYAQTGTVRAKVVDAESGADIPGAVVAITPVGKPDQTKRLTSGYGGAFAVSALRYGDYELVVSFLGYNEYKQNFTLK